MRLCMSTPDYLSDPGRLTSLRGGGVSKPCVPTPALGQRGNRPRSLLNKTSPQANPHRRGPAVEGPTSRTRDLSPETVRNDPQISSRNPVFLYLQCSSFFRSRTRSAQQGQAEQSKSHLHFSASLQTGTYLLSHSMPRVACGCTLPDRQRPCRKPASSAVRGRVRHYRNRWSWFHQTLTTCPA